MREAGLGRFIVRRLLVAIPLLIIITFGVFLLVQLAPGSPERVLLAGRPATPETLAAIRERFNLNEPFLVQYFIWLGGVVRGDFGRSIQSNQLVSDAITQRLGLSVFLMVYASIIAIGVGIPLGMWAALK